MNKRYIRTEIGGEKRIMELDSCNLCPLLYFNHEDKEIRCLKYNRPFKDIDARDSNIIKKCTNGFKFCRGIYLPLEDIKIPDWCGLSNDVTCIQSEIFIKTGQNSYNDYYGMLDCFKIVLSKEVEYDNCFIKLIEKNSHRKVTTNFKNETNTRYLPPKKSDECSYCGENDSSVDRRIKNGMCDKCWDLYKDSKDEKYLSYINNFRLKRKSTRLEKIDKKFGILKKN